MSITFSTEETSSVDERPFDIVCDDAGIIGREIGYHDAYLTAQAHGLVCTADMCAGYGAETREVFADGDPIPVNMANRNAQDILIVLGLCDQVGGIDAGLLLDRIDVALAVGFADDQLDTIAAGNWVEGGRERGYVAERLGQIRDLAVIARARGVRVTWG